MIDIFIGIFLIFLGVYIFFKIIQSYKIQKDLVRLSLSSNFDIVDGKLLKSDIGIKHVHYGKYESTRYFPYIKYSYKYNGCKYINDKFSNTQYLYRSDIEVKKEIKYHKKQLTIYVRKDDPSISYIYIDDDKVDKHIEEFVLGHYFISIISFVIITIGFSYILT